MRAFRRTLGLRCHSKGTKKLTVSFEERNDTLKKFERHVQYPLLKNRVGFNRVSRIKPIVDRYGNIEHTEVPDTPEVELRGRVNGIRNAGKGLIFLDLEEGGSRLQVVMNAKKLNQRLSVQEIEVHSVLRRGDSVSVVGKPWRTKAGELSLLSTQSITLLAPSLHPLPNNSASMVLRRHNRVAQLKAFSDARDVLRARSAIISYLSQFLNSQDFMQVQTPHLSTQKGGATANSFITKMEDGTSLFLRVSPELWLKRMIIAGFDRVYEIGNSYRNEGIDASHNPEFTTCEFYMSFANLDDLIRLTKEALVYISSNLSRDFPHYAPYTAVFQQNNWKTINFVQELEKATGRTLNLDKEFLQDLCKTAGLLTSPENDVPHLLDALAERYIEPQCEGPTFVVNHPSVMAPLAKETEVNGLRVSRRFEFYVGKREYVNSYEEENDPVVQLEKLKMQNSDIPDKSFVEALEWGLPPTGGWGMGIDRLAMLLTNSERIADVLSFGDLTQVRRL